MGNGAFWRWMLDVPPQKKRRRRLTPAALEEQEPCSNNDPLNLTVQALGTPTFRNDQRQI